MLALSLSGHMSALFTFRSHVGPFMSALSLSGHMSALLLSGHLSAFSLSGHVSPFMSALEAKVEEREKAGM